MICTYRAIAHAHALSSRRAQAMKLAFQGEERDLEHSIDHEVSIGVRVRYTPS